MESKYNKKTHYGKQFRYRSRVYTIIEDKFIPELGLSGYITEFSCVLYTHQPGLNISIIHNIFGIKPLD